MGPPPDDRAARASARPPGPAPDWADERRRLAEDLAWLVLRRLRRPSPPPDGAPGDARRREVDP
jgi:hypothetical protein